MVRNTMPMSAGRANRRGQPWKRPFLRDSPTKPGFLNAVALSDIRMAGLTNVNYALFELLVPEGSALTF